MRYKASICFHEDQCKGLEEWAYLIKCFNVNGYQRFGGKIGRKYRNIEYAGDNLELIQGKRIVVLSPQNGGGLIGEEPLSSFEHPETCVYYFGADMETLTGEEIEGSYYVYIDMPIQDQIWASQAASIVLYDRYIKARHGNNNN